MSFEKYAYKADQSIVIEHNQAHERAKKEATEKAKSLASKIANMDDEDAQELLDAVAERKASKKAKK